MRKQGKGAHVCTRKIFAIVFEEQNTVFVWHTDSKNLNSTYSHYQRRSPYTRTLFTDAKNCIPGLFVLDYIIGTAPDAYGLCLAWMNFFTLHRYTLLSPSGAQKAAMALNPKNQTYLASIRNKPLSEVLCAENRFMPKPRTVRSPAWPRRLSFSLDEPEFLRVSKAAADQGLSVAAYCKRAVLAGRPVTVSLEDTVQSADALLQVEVLAQGIQAELIRSGRYLPAQLHEFSVAVKALAEHRAATEAMYAKMVAELQQVLAGTK